MVEYPSLLQPCKPPNQAASRPPVGGTLDVTSPSHGGTTLLIDIPVGFVGSVGLMGRIVAAASHCGCPSSPQASEDLGNFAHVGNKARVRGAELP
jgi:hypothetical protein